MRQFASRRRSLLAAAALPAAAMLLVVPAAVSPAQAQAPDGAVLFETHCTSCHLATAIPRALAIDNMRALPPEAIVGALTDGAMREQGAELSPAERRAVAAFITGRGAAAAVGATPGGGACGSAAAADWPGPDGGPQWNGWGAGVTNARFQPASGARLAAADVPRLRIRWAFGTRTRQARSRSRRSWEAGCSSPASAAWSTRSTRGPAARTGRSRRRAECGAP